MTNAVKNLPQRFREMPQQLKLFLAGIVLMGMAGGIFETTYNNYLNDIFHIDAQTRGLMEFPRELPGFLCVFMTGMLFFLPEAAIAGICALIVGLGMIGLGVIGSDWIAMIVLTIFWSIGTHLMMPVSASISMDLAGKSGKGKRLGQMQAAGFAAAIIGSGIVYFTLSHLAGKTDIHLGNYSPVFFIGGAAAIIGSVAFFCVKLPGAHIHRPKLVWRKQYWLFYMLAFLFGGRKQLFITFGPWVLIKIFGEPASTIAKLWIAGSILQVFFQPYLGKLIDRWGERTILLLDSGVLLLVCAGYGLSHYIGNPTLGLWVLYACYVGDMMMFGVNMARSTYVAKIAPRPEDVSPTLSMGITINHAVSMSLPWLGGWVWDKFGHSMVFAWAAGIAVLMAIFSAMIPARDKLNAMEKMRNARLAQ